ncbi:T9SS type A sorting domain-containing protein, partial [bacterium]|nr:T9SS type A sorting domain-containing protein [bacterium]
NDPPVISTIPDTSFNEDEQLKFAISYLYDFVYDPDNADSSLTWSFSDTDYVYVTMDEDSVTLSSQIDWFGKDTLSAKVSDGEFFDEASFVITVHPVNDPPYFTELMPDSISFDSNVSDTLLLTELASDVDNPDSSLSWSYIHSSFVLCHINDTMKTAIFWVEENLSGQDTVVLSVSDGEFTVYDSLIVIVSPVTGIEYLMSQIPNEYSLKQNYPNPFNPTTTIIYGLPKLSHVDIRIYDLLGREVATLVNNNQEAKYYKVIWDAKDRSGNTVPSGMYLYRIVAKSGNRTFVKTRKLLLMR